MVSLHIGDPYAPFVLWRKWQPLTPEAQETIAARVYALNRRQTEVLVRSLWLVCYDFRLTNDDVRRGFIAWRWCRHRPLESWRLKKLDDIVAGLSLGVLREVCLNHLRLALGFGFDLKVDNVAWLLAEESDEAAAAFEGWRQARREWNSLE